MTNYDSIDNDKKQILKNQLIKNATSLGGKNHFLSLIEAIRLSIDLLLNSFLGCSLLGIMLFILIVALISLSIIKYNAKGE